jgi:hypothetical protein
VLNLVGTACPCSHSRHSILGFLSGTLCWYASWRTGGMTVFTNPPGRRPASYQLQQLLLALFQPPPAEPDGNLSIHPALQSENRHTIVSLRPS